MSLDISRVGGTIGAEIHGVDLARTLSDATIAAIRQALLDHLVVFFRGQDLTPPQYLAFARRIGTPVAYPFVPGIEGFPAITPVLKRPGQTINFGGAWHADTTYLPQPPMATMLLACELPVRGGDTMFANQYRAFETLSETMQSLLSGLRGVSRSDKAEASRTREDRARNSDAPKTVLVAGIFPTGMSPEDADAETGGDPVLDPWFSQGLDAAHVKRAAGKCTVILSDNDPYIEVDRAKAVFRATLDPTIVIEHGHGHFNEDDRLQELPSALAAVLS